MHIDYGSLRRLCPHGDPAILAGIVEAAPALLPRYGITTPLRWCHLVAQLAHESDGMRTMVEYASGAAYEGRRDLGNVQVGDGIRYKGRGLIQLTGRANYRRIGGAIGVDLERHPEAAAQLPLALEVALMFWRDRRLNQYADADDVEKITRVINGGINGLADRMRYLGIAKSIWGEGAPANGVRPTLRLGSAGATVRLLQQSLNKVQPGRLPLTEDGRFGERTEVAVIAWQGAHGLVADGVVGPATWESLDQALRAPAAIDVPDPPDPPDHIGDLNKKVAAQEPASSGGFFHALAALFRRFFGG